ncbi:MAG: hypothetical protein Alpg2KO_06210 [Alphaproteobacteria bacterium]
MTAHLADCIVLTGSGRLLLQQRDPDWGASAGRLTLFGGHVEAGEPPLQGLCRELDEELGAQVEPQDVQFIGAVTEAFTGHTELVHIHLWQDHANTITGCYECQPRQYDSVEEALLHPMIMDYARWALLTARQQGFLV